MKVKDLLKEAEDEMIDEKSKFVKGLVKVQLKEINSCRKTLKDLEAAMGELLETDIMDIEDEEQEY